MLLHLLSQCCKYFVKDSSWDEVYNRPIHKASQSDRIMVLLNESVCLKESVEWMIQSFTLKDWNNVWNTPTPLFTIPYITGNVILFTTWVRTWWKWERELRHWCKYGTAAKNHFVTYIISNDKTHMWPRTTKPVISVNFSKLRFIHHLKAE